MGSSSLAISKPFRRLWSPLCWPPWWLIGKEPTCQCRRRGFDPWVRKSPWRRKWQPIPVFLPGKLHGQGSLEGYSPGVHKSVGHDWATKQHQQSLKMTDSRTSLLVQWLRLCTPSAGGWCSTSGWGTRYNMLQLRVCMLQKRSAILRAATKAQCSQINKYSKIKTVVSDLQFCLTIPTMPGIPHTKKGSLCLCILPSRLYIYISEIPSWKLRQG